MNILMPVEKNVTIGRCWDKIRLAIILSKPSLYSWLIDKFIDVRMTGGIVYSYSRRTLEFMQVYDDILNVDRMVDFSDGVINLIRCQLSEKKYIIAVWDEYYIPFSKIYNIKHDFHDVLIYGIDDDKNLLYVFDGKRREVDEDVTVDINLFETAFFSGIKLISNMKYSAILLQGAPFSVVSIRKESVQPNLNRLLYALQMDLANDIGDKEITLLRQGEGKQYRGYKIYDGILELVNRISQSNDNLLEEFEPYSWGLVDFVDSRKLLLDKISWLEMNKYIPQNIELKEKIKNLEKELRTAVNLIFKYSFMKKERYLHEITACINSLKNKDRMIIEEVCSMLELAVWK